MVEIILGGPGRTFEFLNSLNNLIQTRPFPNHTPKLGPLPLRQLTSPYTKPRRIPCTGEYNPLVARPRHNRLHQFGIHVGDKLRKMSLRMRHRKIIHKKPRRERRPLQPLTLLCFQEFNDLGFAEVRRTGVEFATEFRGTETGTTGREGGADEGFLGVDGVVGEDCEGADYYLATLEGGG